MRDDSVNYPVIFFHVLCDRSSTRDIIENRVNSLWFVKNGELYPCCRKMVDLVYFVFLS